MLGKALAEAGRWSESERLLRELIEKCEAQEEFRLASGASGHLSNLLQRRGRLDEALEIARRRAEFIRRAGLGPWTQITSEGMSLQILSVMGRNKEVLERVQILREQMTELPKERTNNEAVEPWSAHETTLNIGCHAAILEKRYETALSFNSEILRLKIERGADQIELARTRFNAHNPLIELRRIREARELLEDCLRIDKQAGEAIYVGRDLSALARLEAEQKDMKAALSFQELALRYVYQARDPEECAIAHNNLANLLQSGAAEQILAHRLAAAAICVQTGSGFLATPLRNLVIAGLPDAPPPFAEVADRVEKLEGVKFRQLFALLPQRAPDGNTALAEVWKLAAQMRDQRVGFPEEFESLPPEVVAAFQSGNLEAFQTALQALPPEEQHAVMAKLHDLAHAAGLLESSGPDMNRILKEFAPILHGVAAVACGDDSPREEIEAVLPQLEQKGWQLTDAVHRIWAGERDVAALTADLDSNSAHLVEHIVKLIGAPLARSAPGGPPRAGPAGD